MMYKWAGIVLLAIYLTLCGNILYAKCVIEKYLITGSIKSLQTDRPVENAHVYVYFDERNHTCTKGYMQNLPEFSGSAKNGTYNVLCYYYPIEEYSMFIWHWCTKEPEIVEIFIIKDGYLATRNKYINKITYNASSMGEQKIILLPDVHLSIK